MSEYHIQVEQRFDTMRLDFFVYETWRDGGGRLLLPGGKQYLFQPASIVPEAERLPLMTLPSDAAHPFLAALSRHLGAVEHPLQLRQDYEHERKRVDRFIDATLENLGILRDRL